MIELNPEKLDSLFDEFPNMVSVHQILIHEGVIKGSNDFFRDRNLFTGSMTIVFLYPEDEVKFIMRFM